MQVSLAHCPLRQNGEGYCQSLLTAIVGLAI
jgi:hypothetical protein